MIVIDLHSERKQAAVKVMNLKRELYNNFRRRRMAGVTSMASSDLSPTMEALEQEPSSGFYPSFFLPLFNLFF